jgi:hypothetical protein
MTNPSSIRASDKYRGHVAAALTDWRLFSVPSRPTGVEAELFRAGIAEILGLRLRIAYMPIFATLERMQKQLDLAFDPRRDPYGPPVRRH